MGEVVDVDDDVGVDELVGKDEGVTQHMLRPGGADGAGEAEVSPATRGTQFGEPGAGVADGTEATITIVNADVALAPARIDGKSAGNSTW